MWNLHTLKTSLNFIKLFEFSSLISSCTLAYSLSLSLSVSLPFSCALTSNFQNILNTFHIFLMQTKHCTTKCQSHDDNYRPLPCLSVDQNLILKICCKQFSAHSQARLPFSNPNMVRKHSLTIHKRLTHLTASTVTVEEFRCDLNPLQHHWLHTKYNIYNSCNKNVHSQYGIERCIYSQ